MPHELTRLPKNEWNEKYYAYLLGDEWKKKRKQVIERAKDKCELCGTKKIRDIHHLTYENIFNESLQDLQGLCRDCHEILHDKQDINPMKIIKKDKAYAGEVSIVCPLCGFPFSHIQHVYTRMGSDSEEAGVYQGTEIKGETKERRSALVIEFSGECEHNWNLVIQQHKGSDMVTVEKLKDTIYPRGGSTWE
jgi:hypothetical protein